MSPPPGSALPSPNAPARHESEFGHARQAARDAKTVGVATTGIGAVMATIVAGACCVSPILSPIFVGVLGASGAVWAAGLKPYAWWILAGAALLLGYGFWSVYRRRTACAAGELPRRSRILSHVANGSLWVGAVLWAAALIMHVIIPQ